VAARPDRAADRAGLRRRPDRPGADLWAAYSERIERELLEDGRFGAIREWGNKQPGRVARLAGLLHLAADPDAPPEISPKTMVAACKLGEYFEAHALATYDVMGALPSIDGARRLLAWIVRTAQSTFTERIVAHAFRVGTAGRSFATMDDLRPCLELLVEHGYLRRGESPARVGPGRPSSPTYLVHPGWLMTHVQNVPNPPPEGDSVHCVLGGQPIPGPAAVHEDLR
jgi:replicative DNA helicase